MTTILFICLFVVVVTLIYMKYHNNDVVYEKSELDENEYLVRNMEDKQNASNLLAELKKNIMSLSEYLYTNKEKYPEYSAYIDQLHEKVQNTEIMETSENTTYTSYSVNKGEKLVFCLRSKLLHNEFHDTNLIMYVVLHEISHVACPEYGHGELFKKIFSFITNVAIEQKMYKKIDFEKIPTEYCGLVITDSIV